MAHGAWARSSTMLYSWEAQALRLCVVHQSAPFEGHDGALNVGLSSVRGPLDFGIDGESTRVDGSPSGCFS